VDFGERYPRSVVLRQAYEQAARASVVLGDDNAALEWGKRALRVLPENPFLLTMMADLASRHGQHQLAETSASTPMAASARRLPSARPSNGRAASWRAPATCVLCHNPHPDDPARNEKSPKVALDSDDMCLQCHQSLRDHPGRHTRHAVASDASRCVSCHMPRNMDALMLRARSHEIDEIPDAEMIARFGEAESPNACLACHRDKDVRSLAGSMAA